MFSVRDVFSVRGVSRAGNRGLVGVPVRFMCSGWGSRWLTLCLSCIRG